MKIKDFADYQQKYKESVENPEQFWAKIASEFKSKGITPYGSSSLEKRVNALKLYFKARNNAHLVAIAKDLGLV